MEIIITGREALDRGIWGKLCELKDWNEWAINEGLMDDTDKITLSEKEAESLNLIPKVESDIEL